MMGPCQEFAVLATDVATQCGQVIQDDYPALPDQYLCEVAMAHTRELLTKVSKLPWDVQPQAVIGIIAALLFAVMGTQRTLIQRNLDPDALDGN